MPQAVTRGISARLAEDASRWQNVVFDELGKSQAGVHVRSSVAVNIGQIGR
jgi:hypothetical protein